MAESAIGVTPAAIGVRPPSLPAKNFDFLPCSLNEVISLSAEDFATLRWGPRIPGGDKGGLRISGILGLSKFWNVSCAADGDVQGSVDSTPVQAKLFRTVSVILQRDFTPEAISNLPSYC